MRRVFSILSDLSLLLFAAVVLLWVRSYFVADGVVQQCSSPDRLQLRAWTVVSVRGHLYISYFRYDFASLRLAEQYHRTRGVGVPEGLSYSRAKAHPRLLPPLPRRLGFAFQNEGIKTDSFGKLSFPNGLVPLWFFALITALPPALRLRSHLRRRHRALHGLCPRCGYDLRASEGRCPECGQPFPASGVKTPQ